MAIIVDLDGQQLTVKIRREFIGVSIDNASEKIIVRYRETQYTGVIGEGSYIELSITKQTYELDYQGWHDGTNTDTTKANIATELARATPGS